MGSLSEIQQQVILGCILGDGYMRKKTHAHLQITHSFKQKEYVDWKYQILKNLTMKPPSIYKGNAERIGYRFYTKNLPEITSFYKRFYPSGIKIIPFGINLTPLTMAVWYMDDGSRSYKSCYFNTQCFDLKSQNNLIRAFKKLGIKSRLNKDKIYHRIRITTGSTPLLMKRIKPYIIKSMRYKIPI